MIDKKRTEIVTSLIISQADLNDSGSYTCDPASSYAQAVIVHVTKGIKTLIKCVAKIINNYTGKPDVAVCFKQKTVSYTHLTLPTIYSV